MSNIIFSVIYLEALLDDLKAALKVRLGGFAPSKNKDKKFCDESLDSSDLEIDDEAYFDQGVKMCFATEWNLDDGIYASRFYVGEVSEGLFILGSEVTLSDMDSDGHIKWHSDKYYLDLEVVKSIALNERVSGDIEQPVALAA